MTAQPIWPRLLRGTLIILLALLAWPSPGWADLVNITDGTSTFTWDTESGASSISSVHGNYSVRFDPLVRYTNSADGLQTRGVASFEGTGSQRAVVSNMVQNIGSVALVTVDYGTRNGNDAPVTDLQLTLAMVILSNEFGGSLTYAMELENVSSTEQQNVELFQYYDWDVGGTTQNTGDRFSLADLEGFVQQGPTEDQRVFHGTTVWENWEVSEWGTIRDKLLDNASLANHGTPFELGDMTAAFGWNVGKLGSGENKNVGLVMEGISAIPEPTHGLLFLLGLLGGLTRRQRP